MQIYVFKWFSFKENIYERIQKNIIQNINRIISLSIINFSIHDLNIKVDKNEKILKTTFKKEKHTID